MELERADRRSLSQAMCLAALLLTGCGRKEQGLVLVTPSVDAPPILRSEADQISIPVRVDAPIRFENRSRVETVFRVSKTGCSCYGMATAESFLKPGEPINVPPGGSKELFFVSKELQGEAEQAFRVGFHAGSEELRADASMKIFPDLVLDPASIVIDLPTAGDGAKERGSSALTITRVTRGKPAEHVPPAFSMSPALIEAGPPVPEKPLKEISPGLWRAVWKVSVRARQFSDEIREGGGRFAFSFEFPESGDPVSTSTGGRPRDGQLPTILDAVGSHPSRKVTGQLILRRSKGIITPSQLHFGTIPAGSGSRTRRLVLSAADHRPFRVTIGDVPSQFSASGDSDDPAEQQWISITFEPGAAGDNEGKLTLKTTHPDQPEVQVTLKARVQ
jgi:hypothetical protein